MITKCPECGWPLSSEALTCGACHYPIREMAERAHGLAMRDRALRRNTVVVVISVIVFAICWANRTQGWAFAGLLISALFWFIGSVWMTALSGWIATLYVLGGIGLFYLGLTYNIEFFPYLGAALTFTVSIARTLLTLAGG